VAGVVISSSLVEAKMLVVEDSAGAVTVWESDVVMRFDDDGLLICSVPVFVVPDSGTILVLIVGC